MAAPLLAQAIEIGPPPGTLVELGSRKLHALLAPGTQLEVRVAQPAMTYSLSIVQLRRSCDGVATSPEETLKKRKLRSFPPPLVFDAGAGCRRPNPNVRRAILRPVMNTR